MLHEIMFLSRVVLCDRHRHLDSQINKIYINTGWSDDDEHDSTTRRGRYYKRNFDVDDDWKVCLYLFNNNY